MTNISRRKQKQKRQIAKSICHNVCSNSSKPDEPPVAKQVKQKLSFDSKSLREEGKRLKFKERSRQKKHPRLNLVDGQIPREDVQKNTDAKTRLHYTKVRYDGHRHDHYNPINRPKSEKEGIETEFWEIKVPDEPRKSLNYRPISLQDSRSLKLHESGWKINK